MKTHYLFPHKFNGIGWILLILGFVMLLYSLFIKSEPDLFNLSVFAILDRGIFTKIHFMTIIENNIFGELIGLFLIVGAVFIAFSREKQEDEFIAKIRLESLVWATYINYGILVLCLIFVYGVTFYLVMVFNLFTTLIFFVVRFKWTIYKSNKALQNEE